MHRRVVVLIPAHNESASIGSTVQSIYGKALFLRGRTTLRKNTS
jgi:hypothetical protein